MSRRQAAESVLDLRSWLRVVGYAGIWETYVGDELEAVDLEEDDDDPETLVYRCPETYRRCRIPREAAAVFQVDPQAFLNGVADLLDIPGSQRTGINEPRIEGILWKLGEARLDGIHVSVYVVRSLGFRLEEVVRVMESTSAIGLLLNTGRSISDVVRLPDGVNVCQPADAIVTHLETTSLDKSWLKRQKVGPASVRTRRPHLPVSYDRERRVLSIRGKPDWVIKGEKQAKAVEYMYQQALQERTELSPDEIFTATRIKTGTGGSVRMQSLFKGNPNWTLYIANPRHGIYTFNLA